MRGGRGAGLDDSPATKRGVESDARSTMLCMVPLPAIAGADSRIRSRGSLKRPSFAKAFYERPGQWSPGRRQTSWPRHAGECYHSLALRAWRAPQNDPLARTACFGRAAPPGAPPRFALGPADPPQNRTRPCRPASPGWRPLRARLVRHVTKRGTIVNGSVTNYFPVIPGRAPGGEPRARHRAGHFGPDPLAAIRNDNYPRNAARLTGPPNRPAISFSAPAARASLQPPCLALSTNLSSTSARVSGSCAPPRI